MKLGDFLPGSRKARTMVALGFVCQNCTTGLVLGSYGALLPRIESSFETTREFSSLGIGLFALMVGLMSPLVGVLLRRVPVRSMMAAGAMVSLLGYLALAMVESITAFLVVFALFIGVGTAMTGVVAPATLVSRWYRGGRGRALGLVNLPIFLIVIPPIAATVVTSYGMAAWFLGAAAIFMLLVPLMLLMVVDEPAQVGEIAHGAVAAAEGEVEPATIRMTAFIANPQFWLLTLGVGFSSGVGTAFMTHIIPYAEARGISIQSGSLLITVYGAAGLLGNLIFGWLADRLGAVITLGISALGQALLWAALLFASGLPMLLGVAALLGMFTTSVIALHGAAANELFGHRNISGVLGLGYLFKIPFNFGAAPFAGYLFVTAGSYSVPFATFSAGLLAAALGFAMLAALRSGSRLQLQG